MHKNFLDSHGFFMEIEDGKKLMLDPEINHVAIGCAHDDKKLFLVELYSKKQTGLDSIKVGETDD